MNTLIWILKSINLFNAFNKKKVGAIKQKKNVEKCCWPTQFRFTVLIG